MKTVDISGMGGGYENACQKLVKAAVEHMEKNGAIPRDEFSYSQWTDRAKEVEKAMLAAVDNDCTGVMFVASLGHALYVIENGREKWLELFNGEPHRYYEWDGTVNSCPKTDISEKMEAEQGGRV